jgi:hypothetical protein
MTIIYRHDEFSDQALSLDSVSRWSIGLAPALEGASLTPSARHDTQPAIGRRLPYPGCFPDVGTNATP